MKPELKAKIDALTNKASKSNTGDKFLRGLVDIPRLLANNRVMRCVGIAFEEDPADLIHLTRLAVDGYSPYTTQTGRDGRRAELRD